MVLFDRRHHAAAQLRLSRLQTHLREMTQADDPSPYRRRPPHQVLVALGESRPVEASRPRRHHDGDVGPLHESVRLGDCHHALRSLCREVSLAPEQAEGDRHPQDDGRGLRLLQLVGQVLRIAHDREGAVGIAEEPAGERLLVPAASAGIVAGIEERLRGVALALVEGHPPLHVGDGGRRLAHREQRRPQRVMGLDQAPAVVASLGVGQQARAGLARRLVTAEGVADEPQPPHHGEPARRVAQALHEAERLAIDLLHARVGGAVQRDRRRRQGDADVEPLGQRRG